MSSCARLGQAKECSDLTTRFAVTEMDPLGAQSIHLATKLRGIQKKKDKVIKKLDILSAFNVVLFVCDLAFIILTIIKTCVDSLAFKDSVERNFYVTTASLSILNMIALIFYWYGCTYRIWTYVTKYIWINAAWAFAMIIANLILAIKEQFAIGTESTQIIIILAFAFILAVVNAAITSIVNIHMKKMTIYDRKFSRTLSSTVSKSTSQEVGNDTSKYDEFIGAVKPKPKTSSIDSNPVEIKGSKESMGTFEMGTAVDENNQLKSDRKVNETSLESKQKLPKVLPKEKALQHSSDNVV